MLISGDTKYDSIYYENATLPYSVRYLDEANGVAYNIYQTNTQAGVPLSWEQTDLEGNVLSTFAPVGWLWQLRNCEPFFDAKRQLLIHQVLVPDSEFSNNQAIGDLVTCMIVMRINKDDFANSTYFLIQMENSGDGSQVQPPFASPDVNTVWRFDGIDEESQEVYYTFGGNTSNLSWGLVNYDENDVIDNLNMVSRTWGPLYTTGTVLQARAYSYVDYASKIVWMATTTYPVKLNYANGDYIVRSDIPIGGFIGRMRALSPKVFEFLSITESKMYVLDEDLNTISSSDWDYEGSLYFKDNDPSIYLSSPIRTVVRIQNTKDKPLISGDTNGTNQINKNNALRSGEVVLEQTKFLDLSSGNSNSTLIYYDEDNDHYYIDNSINNYNVSLTIKKYDSNGNLLATLNTGYAQIRYPSLPYFEDGNLYYYTRVGFIEINIDYQDFTNSQVSLLNAYSFTSRDDLLYSIIFDVDSDYIYAFFTRVPTQELDGQYLKIAKSTGVVADSTVSHVIGDDYVLNNYFKRNVDNNLYHQFRLLPDTNYYRVFNIETFELEYTSPAANIPGIDSNNYSVVEIMSYDLWKILYRTTGDVWKLSIVNIKTNSVLSSINLDVTFTGNPLYIYKKKNGDFIINTNNILQPRTFKLTTK